jgi:hypothetical protein
MQRLGKILTAGALSAVMLGATIGFAATLADYPSPFIEDGRVNTLVVVGERAATADVVGAINLAARLGSEVGIEGTCPACPAVEGVTTLRGGVQIASDALKPFINTEFDTVKSTITSTDLPDLLGTKTFTDKDGTTITYYEQILLGNQKVLYGKGTDFTNPDLYVSFSSSNPYTLKILFIGGLDLSKVDSTTKITLFGKEYKFGSGTNATAEIIELYSATGATTLTLDEVGESQTVTVGDKTLTFELKGWSPDGTKAFLYVNGAPTSPYGWEEGSTYTVSGVKVYVSDVSLVRTGAQAEYGTVTLFVGTDKIVMKDNYFEKNDEQLPNVDVSISSSAGKVNSIEISVAPDIETYMKDGETFTDPVFGSFKFSLNGLTPGLKSATRDLIKVEKSGTNKVKLTFTNKEGTTYSFNIFYNDGSSWSMSYDGSHKVIAKSEDTAVSLGDYVILSDPDTKATYVYRLATHYTGTNPYATFTDITTGSSIKVYSSDPYIRLGENSFKVEGIGSTIKVDLNGDGTVNASHGVNIYTKTGAVLNVTATSNDKVKITETPIYNLSGEPTGTSITATASYSSNDVSFSLSGITTHQFGSENRYGGVTEYGTYVEHDTDADTIKIYYPGNRPAYALVAVGPNPVWSTTEATPGTSAITYKKSVPVTVPLAVLDSKVTSAHRAEKHLILVGGPCVNSLVAELATAGKLTYEGSPLTCDAWNARTDAGDVFGLLRLVENAFATGKVALVVAGSRAEQTRWATSILQNFDQYNLTGTAVKITSPNTIETI